MNRFLAGFFLFALVGSAFGQIPNGTNFTIDWLYPTVSDVLATANKTVVPGAEVNCPGGVPGDTPTICSSINVASSVSMDVSEQSIVLTTIRSDDSGSWSPSPFNGFRFTFPAGIPPFVSVNLVTNDPGFSMDNVSFTATTVSINLQGRNMGYTYTLNLHAKATLPVPSLSTTAAVLLSLVVLGTGLAYCNRYT